MAARRSLVIWWLIFRTLKEAHSSVSHGLTPKFERGVGAGGIIYLYVG